MNTIIKHITRSVYFPIILSAALLGFNACDGYLDEKDSPRLTVDYYGTAQGVEAAATAAYAYMRWGVGNERFNVLTEYGTDLFTQGEDGGSGAASCNQYGNQLNSALGVLYEMWSNHYKAISTTNLVLQQMEKSTMNEADKRAAIAEMSFLRAYFYFDLVQQFGRIPKVTDVSYEVRTAFPRASVSDIYELIISDLTYAARYLPETPKATGRATRYAAAHLLAKAYLTRGSAVTDQRGQKNTDMDSTLLYAEKVLAYNKLSLVPDFADLWDIDNQGNSEVIFSVQFTSNLVYDGDGNKFHLYWGSWYEDQTGMVRDLTNGRPYRRHTATNKTMLQLFDRKNDSRYYKSFKWAYYVNNSNNILATGDTSIYYSLNPPAKTYRYAYFTWNATDRTKNIRYYPPLLKYFDPKRASFNEEKGTREWVRMRLGETYLIAAEAAGRKGDFETAADYINKIRERAAWHEGETKMPQYWREEGGAMNDIHSTYDNIKVSANDISTDFVDFMLDERGRELLGETNRWEDLVRCEKLVEYVLMFNPDASGIQPYHKLRPIPQNHIDRLDPKGPDSEEQNEGYYAK